MGVLTAHFRFTLFQSTFSSDYVIAMTSWLPSESHLLASANGVAVRKPPPKGILDDSRVRMDLHPRLQLSFVFIFALALLSKCQNSGGC